MRITDLLLAEYDLETAYTRKHLERVPEDRLGWKPHGKSMTLGRLATFLALIPTWGVDALERDSFDVAPPGAAPPPASEARSRAELLERFDRNVAALRAAIAAAGDERLAKPWALLAGGKPLFTRPRYLVLRTLVLNHAIHHRAQLGVYLRLSDIAVPAIYNDSADERGGMFMEATPAPR